MPRLLSSPQWWGTFVRCGLSFQDRFCLRRIFRSLSVVALSFPSRCRWRILIRFGLLQSRRICQRHSREGRGGLGGRGTFSKSFLYFRFVSNPILFWTFGLIFFLSILYCLVTFANRPLFQPFLCCRWAAFAHCSKVPGVSLSMQASASSLSA